jgi:putative transposase
MPKFDPQKHHRRSIRLPGYDYTQARAYFVTIVTHNRENIFGEVVDGEMRLNGFGEIAKREWERLPKQFKHIELGAFIIMPNHVHGIIIIHDNRRGTADLHNQDNPQDPHRRGTADFPNQDNPQDPRRAPTTTTTEKFGKPVSGSIPTIMRSYKSAVALRVNYARPGDSTPVWQRNYYERIIRNEREMGAIWRYIQSNPARWADDNENPDKQS